MNAETLDFVKSRFIPLLKEIPSDTPPRWGKMTLQQMIEHFTDSVQRASGRVVTEEIVIHERNLEKFRDFLMSDKPYPQNIVNPLVPEVPAPVKNKSIEKAIEDLQTELNYFFSAFDANQHLTTLHPFFGELNFEMNVLAIYKHAVHHLRQFGVEVE